MFVVAPKVCPSRRRRSDTDETITIDISPRPVQADGAYFPIVRAFLSWCVSDELIDSNPAEPNRVTKPLPNASGKPSQRFWTSEGRSALLGFVDTRVRDALAVDGFLTDKFSGRTSR